MPRVERRIKQHRECGICEHWSTLKKDKKAVRSAQHAACDCVVARWLLVFITDLFLLVSPEQLLGEENWERLQRYHPTRGDISWLFKRPKQKPAVRGWCPLHLCDHSDGDCKLFTELVIAFIDYVCRRSSLAEAEARYRKAYEEYQRHDYDYIPGTSLRLNVSDHGRHAQFFDNHPQPWDLVATLFAGRRQLSARRVLEGYCDAHRITGAAARSSVELVQRFEGLVRSESLVAADRQLVERYG